MSIWSMNKTIRLTYKEWHRLAGTNLGAQMIKNSIRLHRPYGIENDQILYKWLDENCQGLYYNTGYVQSEMMDVLYFEFEEDMVGFKIRWL